MEENKKIMEITDCERNVMVIFWRSSKELSMQEVTEECNQGFGKDWKTQTVSTFLQRLRKKDYLSMQRKRRAFYYTPLVTKEEYIASTIPQLFKLLDISREAVLSLNKTESRMKQVTDCERLVLLIIWAMEAGATDMAGKIPDLQDITVAVNKKYGKEWKTQTISTFLSRLVSKGFLSMQRKGRDFLYTTLVTKAEYIESTVPQLLELLDIDREMILSSNWWD